MRAERRECLWLVGGFRFAVSDWSIRFKGVFGGVRCLPSSRLGAQRPWQHPLTHSFTTACDVTPRRSLARWNITLRDKWRILRALHAVRFSQIKWTPRQRPMSFTMTLGLITTLCAITAVFAMEGKYVDVCLFFWRAPWSVSRSRFDR